MLAGLHDFAVLRRSPWLLPTGAAVFCALTGLVVSHGLQAKADSAVVASFADDARVTAQEFEYRLRLQTELLANSVALAASGSLEPRWRTAVRIAESSMRNSALAGSPGVMLVTGDLQTADLPPTLVVGLEGRDSRGGRLLDGRSDIDPLSAAAALQARNAGEVTAAGPFADAGSPGRMRLLAPFYTIDSATNLFDRQHNFAGVLVAELDLTHQSSAPSALARVSDVLVDGEPVSAGEPGQSNAASGDHLSRRVTSALAGRDWTFIVQSTDAFERPTDGGSSRSVLLAFLLVSALTAAATWIAARLVRQSAERQRELSHELERRLGEAQRLGASLESFSYIVSHDLKTPLRGIGTLTELMEEVLDERVPADPAADDAARDYLDRMKVQIKRMNDLIQGIHDYSTVGLSDDLIATIDTRRTVMSIADGLSVGQDRLVLSGDFPMLRTYAVRFEQTLANLIGNAFKYHHDVANARVEISVSSFGDFYAFSVKDNGPGIAAQHHERIFDVFEALEHQGVESSGVGLAIVKKAVESLGGMISVESAPGEGATFRFLWPKEAEAYGGVDA